MRVLITYARTGILSVKWSKRFLKEKYRYFLIKEKLFFFFFFC